VIKTILYVGSEYEYNIVANGEALNKKGFFNNFETLGYDVTPIWYEGDHSDLQQEIIETAGIINPELIFFILHKEKVKS
jgi:hypothetical protein